MRPRPVRMYVRMYGRARTGSITFNYVAEYPATWSRLTMLMLRPEVDRARDSLAIGPRVKND